jgi:hypothetical protein
LPNGWAAGRRHRCNHDTAVHTRHGYLKSCHYKHWLVDRRQQLWYAITSLYCRQTIFARVDQRSRNG